LELCEDEYDWFYSFVDAARRYSDETGFIIEIYLLVDHSKVLLFIKALQKVFQR